MFYVILGKRQVNLRGEPLTFSLIKTGSLLKNLLKNYALKNWFSL
jgi:hypothetical protein